MSRRISWLLVVLVLVSLANLFVRGGMLKSLSTRSELASAEYPDILNQVMKEIEENFVEEVDSKNLLYGALHGMVYSLNDPHSSFSEPDSFEQIQQNTQGHFGGLGIIIGIKDGYLTVFSTLDGTPAERAGVKTGDRILKISGKPTQGIDPAEAVKRLRIGVDPAFLREFLGITLPEAVNELRGPVGEPVTITVGMEGEKPRDITITRERIELDSVTDVKIVDDGIGYLRVTDFCGDTIHRLNKAIDELRDDGMQSLILDLRNNPGGLLDSAVEVADRFIPDGKLIVSMRGRREERIIKKTASDGFPHSHMPLAVLVNEYSASGSEIVAGALQDWGCAVIIGKKTYGKGSVQNLIPLKDGSGLRLTTSRYYSPDGKVIDKVGITPDVVVESAPYGNGKKENGEKEENHDPQLAHAITILKCFKIFEKTFTKG